MTLQVLMLIAAAGVAGIMANFCHNTTDNLRLTRAILVLMGHEHGKAKIAFMQFATYVWAGVALMLLVRAASVVWSFA